MILMGYRRLPPPPPRLIPPPPPREAPILDDPRWLLARAPPPLPLDDPPNALRLLALGEFDTWRLPTRSPPPPEPRFDCIVPALGLPPPPRDPPRSIVPACGPLPRAGPCRLAPDSPRVAPPYLLAVARSEYGAPPRCCGLCCQLLLTLFRFTLLTRLLLFTKLLLWLMTTLFPPPCHPQL